MSIFQKLLVGRQIDCVHVDSEVTYIMLTDGTQVTIRGLVVVSPGTIARVTETNESARER